MGSVVKCDYCGKEFEKRNKFHRFCSDECKSKYRWEQKPTQTGTCRYCGKEFTYKFDSYNSRKFFCSKACAVAGTVIKKRLKCVDCGVEFDFIGRTTKLRCDACAKARKSKQVMESRARYNPSVQIGVGSGGAQAALYTGIPKEVRDKKNKRRRELYVKNKELNGKEWNYRKLVITGEDKCEICGYSDRQDALIVHHLNMDRSDNSVENLAIICANCHQCVHKFITRQRKRIIDYLPEDGFKEYVEYLHGQSKIAELSGKTSEETTRTEGCEESQSGAERSSKSRPDMSYQEAATEQPELL